MISQFQLCESYSKGLIMGRANVMMLCLVSSVLQVFSDEAGVQPKVTCASLCDQVDFGYAGICCGKARKK